MSGKATQPPNHPAKKKTPTQYSKLHETFSVFSLADSDWIGWPWQSSPSSRSIGHLAVGARNENTNKLIFGLVKLNSAPCWHV